jgi:type I restriction enzyme S subunit
LDIRDGTHDSPKQCDQGYPLITSKHIVSGVLAIEDAYLISHSDYEQVNKRSKVDRWDILISMIGTVGIPYFVMQDKVDFAIKNIGLFKTSKSPELAAFFYLWLISPLTQQDVRSRIAGTTQGYISLGTLRMLEVILPPLELIRSFNQIVEPLLGKIFENTSENIVLSNLRDTLLPKLMSGELRVA